MAKEWRAIQCERSRISPLRVCRMKGTVIAMRKQAIHATGQFFGVGGKMKINMKPGISSSGQTANGIVASTVFDSLKHNIPATKHGANSRMSSLPPLGMRGCTSASAKVTHHKANTGAALCQRLTSKNKAGNTK